ncbi:hypothetical protein CHUAL_012653 [Chamberlinius hualienensis]
MASLTDEDNEDQLRSGLKSFINRADRMIMNFVRESHSSALPPIAPDKTKTQPKSLESIKKFVHDIDNRSIGRELYHFVSDTLNTKLRTCIQNEIRSQTRYDSEDVDEHLINDCVETIMESQEYHGFEKSLCESIDQMSKQMRSDCSSVSIELENVSSWTRDSSEHVQILFREEDDQSLASSCSADCWGMLNGERLRDLIDNLDVQNPVHIQREALRMLVNSPVSELITFDSWPLLKTQLKSFLVGHSSVPVFETVLQLHVKMLLSSSSLCVREGYVNLSESIHLRFKSSSSLNRKEIFDTNENWMLLFLCKLANIFQKTLPRYWTRIPEQHNEAIVETTVSLLMDFSDNLRQWTPLNIFAFLDPFATSFKSWMCSQYGKKLMLNAFKRRPTIIPNIYKECLTLMENIKGLDIVLNEDDFTIVPASYMNYLLVIHLINILTDLFQCSNGCRLFNSQVPNVNVQGCIGRLVDIIAEFCRNCDICNRFCLGSALVNLLTKHIQQEVASKGSYSTEDVMEPLRQWVDYCAIDERSELSDGDVHSLIHFSECLILLTEHSDVIEIITTETDSAMCDVTLMDSVMSITEKLLLTNSEDVSENIMEFDELKYNFIKITCRLCGVHGGISRLLLRGLQLLRLVAEEWESVLRKGEKTPIPGDCVSQKSQENSMLRLKDAAIIGCTPIGVAALQEVGLLLDIISNVELDFDICPGDLLLLSQVSTAANVFNAMQSVLDVLANNLWVLISEEIIAEDNLDTGINRLFSKLIAIVPPYYLSRIKISFTADPREITGVGRLIVAGVNGYQACMCSELACEAGMQLLVILCSDLDCWLYLQIDHNMKECLLLCQRSMMDEDSDSQPYVDQMTLLRNYLLIKTSEIGGEGEKIVPLNNCDDIDRDDREWSFMSTSEIPSCYIIVQPPVKEAPNEIALFLQETCSGQLDSNWLNYCREQFRSCLTNEDVLFRGKWYGELLYYAMEAQEELGPTTKNNKNERPCATTDETELLAKLLFNGGHLVRRYGARLQICEDNEKVVDDLMEVMSDLHDPGHEGFDWFIATVFLLMCGNPTKTFVFMKHTASIGIDLWMTSCKSKDLKLWLSFCQCVEVIMYKELPLVANTLKWTGLSVGQVCQLWIGQCFWNILNWEEICQYVGLCLLMGQDYQVYCMVAIFRHLQMDILEHSQREDLSIFLKETRINRFSFRDYLPFMDYLESKYKDILHKTMDSGNFDATLALN